MAKRSDQIKRNVERLLSSGKGKSHFSQGDSNQLWFWQGHMRVNVKEALSLDLPTVYGPPRANLAESSDNKDVVQLWKVETEPGINIPLTINLAKTATNQPAGFVLKIFERADDNEYKNFCGQITSAGLACGCFSIRTSESFGNDIYKLAQVYLDGGRCLGGVIASDLIRIIDHIEHQFQIEGEPIVLVISGEISSVGLACGAIDQRISGIIIDYMGKEDSLISFTGKAPFFRDPYLHLGTNPWLVLGQCCVPRPIAILNPPNNTQSKPPVDKMLTLTEQIDILRSTYKSAGKEGNLYVFDKPPLPDVPEIIKRFFT